MDLDLTLGSVGATLSGIAPRLYSHGARIAVGGDASLSPVSGAPTRYTLAGLPGSVLGDYRLTWEFPAGVYGSSSWETPAYPPAIVLPLRAGGLAAGDLDLVLLRNGALTGYALHFAELGGGSEPGDYLVWGWPAPAPGERWSLSWALGGIYGMETWRRKAASAAIADWREADKAAIRELLAGWAPTGVPAASPVTGAVPGIAGGWAGIVPERAALVPTPVPSGKRALPTIFAAWRLVYERVAGLYEPGGNPPRIGKLICSAYSEDGAQDGPIDALFAGLAQELDAYSDLPDARLCFNGEDAAPQTIGPRPPWTIVNLNVPFQA